MTSKGQLVSVLVFHCLQFSLLASLSQAACPGYLASVLNRYQMNNALGTVTTTFHNGIRVEGVNYQTSKAYASTSVSVFDFGVGMSEIQIDGTRIQVDFDTGTSRNYGLNATIQFSGCLIDSFTAVYSSNGQEFADPDRSSVTVTPASCGKILSDPASYQFAKGKTKKTPSHLKEVFDQLDLVGNELDPKIVKAAAETCVRDCYYFASGCKPTTPTYIKIAPYQSRGIDQTRVSHPNIANF